MSEAEKNAQRTAQIKAVVTECIHLRVDGAGPSDQQLLTEHVDLLPELGDELRKLALIEAAERRVGSSVDPSAGLHAAELPPDDAFPDYEITGEIHRGGQGVVYRALQKSTQRTVAIKVMHAGPFAGSADRARFDREIQILGRFSHPAIVAIHESGVAAGSAYFVMDYIEGAPLDTYMAQRERSVPDTLRLFARICDAVSAAHLRGVIHRDLKPGNIRVDAAGEPHVLDFGLARVVDDSAAAQAFTVTGQFVGSMPWASPEQAEGARDRIDMRTDVYSLGVIGYQMLTGQFPYPVSGSVRDVVDRILTAEPIRPRTLRGQINDEVETIVLKCLAKEPERRYQTAGELSRDIRHYLAGEPIEAKRDSTGYVLGKHLRRHRLPLAIAAGFVLIVTVGFFTSLAFWRLAVEERDIAEDARTAESEQRAIAEASAAQATKEAAKAHAVVEFLTDDLLAAADPGKSADREITVKEVLDDASVKVEGAFDGQPLVEAQIRLTLGDTYVELGEYESAEPHLVRALELRTAELGEDDLASLAAMARLGYLYTSQGRYAEAEPLNLHAYETYTRLLGDEHRRTLYAANDLALLYVDQGRLAEAEPLLSRALETRQRVLGAEHPQTYDSMFGLAALYMEQGRYAEAEPLYAQTLAFRRRTLGEGHTQTFTALGNLAAVQLAQHRYDEAAPLCIETAEMSRRIWGPEHPKTISAMTNLAVLYARQGRRDEAAVWFREILDVRRRAFGATHPETLSALGNLAQIYVLQARLEEAEPLLLESIELSRELLGADHPRTLGPISNLGVLYIRQGRYAEAEPLILEVLEIRRAALGHEHPRTLTSLNNLGLLRARQGRHDEAETLYVDVLDCRRRTLGAEHPQTLRSALNLAGLRRAQGRHDEAETLAGDALDIATRTLGAAHPITADALYELALVFRDDGCPDEAEPLLLRATESRRRILGRTHPDTIDALRALATLYRHQGRLEEAERHVLQNYEVAQTADGPVSERLRAAAALLADLYETWGDPEQAAAWRARSIADK